MFGEYSDFVIPAYAITTIAFIVMITKIKMLHSNRLKELAKLEIKPSEDT